MTDCELELERLSEKIADLTVERNKAMKAADEKENAIIAEKNEYIKELRTKIRSLQNQLRKAKARITELEETVVYPATKII